MRLGEALRVIQQREPADAKSFTVGLACGFEPLHFKTFLHAHLRRLFPEESVRIRGGVFGDLVGTLERLVPGGGDVCVAMLEWQDFDPRFGLRRIGGWSPAQHTDMIAGAQDQAARFLPLLRRLAESGALVVSLPTLPIPPVDHHRGVQAGIVEVRLHQLASMLASEIVAFPNTRLVSSRHVGLLSPMDQRWDVKSDMAAGFPYSLEHASCLAEMVAGLVKAPCPKKGLITDLDDTLWRGLLGESGINGVSWDLACHSHIHALYQQMLQALADAGILIGVASRNNPDLVQRVFETRELHVSGATLFPVEANWGPKSESVRRILEVWNVGPESVVFVDDSPMEIDEVRSVFPQMNGMLFPCREEARILPFLQELRDQFGKETVLEEDAFRMDSLRQAKELTKHLRSGEADESFLESLNGRVAISDRLDPKDDRAFELVNKTNQFNLNGIRYSRKEWQDALAREDAFMMTVSYRDRYGPLGKIAVLMGTVSGHTARVQVWVMSCRAFGRRIEHRCLEQLFKRLGVAEVAVDFRETDRNAPIRDFIRLFLGSSPGGEFVLSEKIFEGCRPSLHHRIEDVQHD